MKKVLGARPGRSRLVALNNECDIRVKPRTHRMAGLDDALAIAQGIDGDILAGTA